jgi:hypothetical protein
MAGYGCRCVDQMVLRRERRIAARRHPTARTEPPPVRQASTVRLVEAPDPPRPYDWKTPAPAKLFPSGR